MVIKHVALAPFDNAMDGALREWIRPRQIRHFCSPRSLTRDTLAERVEANVVVANIPLPEPVEVSGYDNVI